MMSLYTAQISFEEQQKSYQDLQELINDIIEDYELESISYELARQKISDAIQTYYPELFEKYGTESDKIQEIIDKKLADVKTTKESSEDINKTVDESNEKILESYTALQENLDEVFEQMNDMLQTFADNTRAMASTICNVITDMQNKINDIANMSTTVLVENTTKVKETVLSKTASKVKTAGKSHSGMELGYIGENNLSKDKKDFQYLALNELENDEIVRVLQKNEGVVTEGQVSQIMDNFRKITQVKIPTLLPNNNKVGQSISFNGDIIVNNPVGDSSALAREIKKSLGNAMIQELYRK